MGKNNNIISDDVKVNLQRVDSNVKKVEEHLNDVLKELKQQNKPKKKHKFSNRVLTVVTLIISSLSLIVAFFAMISSNKLATNNSALNFTYENIDIEGIDPTEGIPIDFKDIGVESQGGINISINTKVISGQIQSLYLIQKRNDKFLFSLLNNEGIQNKYSGINKYKGYISLEMEKKSEDGDIDIGMAQIYILAVDMNGGISIDTIQIVGPIIKKYENKNDSQEITVYATDKGYTFRYLKGNRLITLNNNDDVNEEWVNFSDKYLDIIDEANFKSIEEDISKIKENYSAIYN